MCRLRLRAQDDLGGSMSIFSDPKIQILEFFFCIIASQKNGTTMDNQFVETSGIQVVVEVGLGLGVFAGDALGIGNHVRQLSAPCHALDLNSQRCHI